MNLVGASHLLHFLVLGGRLQDSGNVLGEAELLERLGDVIAGNRLLSLLLRDLVGLGRHERDELDAAVDEEVSRFLREGHPSRGGQDL